MSDQNRTCEQGCDGLGDWQPIDTAPKNGTEVLLYAPGRLTYGHWAAPSPEPRIKYEDGFSPEPEWDEFAPYWASWDGGFTDDSPPTHWMPLPPPPQESTSVAPPETTKEQPK